MKIDADTSTHLPLRLFMMRALVFERERGASLFVSMIFLIILTILGLAAMRVATLEERMSGNARDRSLAFQAAEAALRDGETDIENKNFDRTGDSTRAVKISGLAGATATCTNGLCCNLQGLTCVEPSTPLYKSSKLDAGVAYGTYTGASALSGLSQQPRYLIEPFLVDGKSYYRITARGYGLNANTQVTLQEVYYKE